ncbi:MAG: hypothetical protein Q8K63_10865, partial [Acidimicrobiales bacterium]|nr:hypothetical protein [Acidimicrobiales bacterium]
CLVTAVGSGTITVRRGWAGSAAVAHASGVRVAAAVSSWPYSVKLDLTDDCPAGRAGGMFATPGTGSERARDWMARRTAGFFRAASWDGVAIDVCPGYISWFKGDIVGQSYRTIASRANPAVEIADYSAYDAQWTAGVQAMLTGVRTLTGPDAIVLQNVGIPAFGVANGTRIETFPTKTTSAVRWQEVIVGPSMANSASYLEMCAGAKAPNFTTLQTYGDAVTDYQLMRFGLTSALMADGFFSFAVGDQRSLSYDEFDNAGAGKGYLGSPVGAAYPARALTNSDLLGNHGGFGSTSDLSAWTLFLRTAEYAAVKSLDGTTAKVQVTRSAGVRTGVLLDRSNVAVKAGTPYTLTFRARADRPLAVQADVWQEASPWTGYMHSNEIPLTSEWRTFELPLTSSGTDPAAVMGFSVGGAVGTIWFDDVKLQEGTRTVYRRDFDGGIALVNPTDAPATVDLGGTYRKIRGGQAPAVNDGSLVTAVSIPPKDGLVLLRDPSVPARSTVVGKPVVKRTSRRRTRTTYSLSGSIRLGHPSGALSAPQSTFRPTTPVVAEIQVERYSRKRWRVYKRIRLTNPSSRYRASVRLRSGKYRARTLVTGGGVPAVKSRASKSFRVR